MQLAREVSTGKEYASKLCLCTVEAGLTMLISKTDSKVGSRLMQIYRAFTWASSLEKDDILMKISPYKHTEGQLNSQDESV